MKIVSVVAIITAFSFLSACTMVKQTTGANDGESTAQSESEAAQAEVAPAVDRTGKVISGDFPFEKKFVEVDGSKIAYVDEGNGPVVLFLHGNPTSSYLWRNIIPYVSDDHRAIAVDLIGMGDSDKPDIGYTFGEHAQYIDGFIDALGLSDITLVIHDWGSVIGMRYARLNPDNVKAMAFMEAIVAPAFPVPTYEALGPEFSEFMQGVRTEGVGEDMILHNNIFVEVMLPSQVVRPLGKTEMAAYRKPFQTPESRLPTLQWPRELPIAGEPVASVNAVNANSAWLKESELPKLLIHSVPGGIGVTEYVAYMRENLTNLDIVEAGPGYHFLQEDQPHVIGQAISNWLEDIE